jgi:DNA-binding MarR family transcriptional regulator
MNDRTALEATVIADVQALSAESDQIGRDFAGAHDLSANDFRALLHVMVAENAGTPLTAGELRNRMGLSGAAITYLVERMMTSGHLRRESDPADRRKVILRYAQHGIDVGRAFFTPLADHTHRALADLSDEDLAAAHRVFTAVLAAMGGFRADLSAPDG